MKDGRAFLVGLATLLAANLMLVGLCSSCEEAPPPPKALRMAPVLLMSGPPTPPMKIVVLCGLSILRR